MGEIPEATLRREGEPLSALRHVYVMGVGEKYCTALSIQILRGRDFEIADRGRKPIPVIVNRTLAREFFAEADPIGQHLLMGREKEDLLEIVAVAADSKMRTLGEANVPAFFKSDFNAQLLVRVAGHPSQWIEPLRSALGEVDRSAALDIRPLEEAAAGALFPMRVATGFVGSLSGLGLALALVGLYGSVSYAVGRRTRELGIRAALGASRRRIVSIALRDGTAVLACGAGIGVPLAFLVSPMSNSLLPEIARLRSLLRLRQAFRLIDRTLILAGLAAVAACTIGVAVRQPVIALLFQRGSFTADSTRLVAAVFLGFAPGLIGWSLFELTARSLFALDKPSLPLTTAAVPVLCNLAFLLAVHRSEPQFIGLGASLGFFCGFALLFVLARSKRSQWLAESRF